MGDERSKTDICQESYEIYCNIKEITALLIHIGRSENSTNKKIKISKKLLMGRDNGTDFPNHKNNDYQIRKSYNKF